MSSDEGITGDRVNTHASSEKGLWLFSRRSDFWLACGGASVALLAAVLLILWHGDRELDAMDFVLSEFHLGATYDAVIRRRLWRHRHFDVLLIPLVILALTYVLSLSGQTIWLTSIALYAAVWHRGRQNFGVARFYQRQVGGPVSRAHDLLFRGAIYLPMLAAVLAYTHLAPTDFEGKPYLALNLGAESTSLIGLAAVVCVTVYLALMLLRTRGSRPGSRLMEKGSQCFDKLSMNGKYSIISRFSPFAPSTNSGQALRFSKGERRVFQQPASENQRHVPLIHPGERWVVLAHAVAFGSAYALGASNASFLLVLAVHHEVQYLYFTYAMARRTSGLKAMNRTTLDLGSTEVDSKALYNAGPVLRTEAKFAASFLVWPVIGFTGAIVGGWAQLQWLAPLGIGGLFCHYWLDGRIWTRRSFQN